MRDLRDSDAFDKDPTFDKAQLAKALGISAPMVAYYERHTANPTVDAVSLLSDYFDVPSSYFLDEAPWPARRGKRGPQSKIEKRMAKLKTLPKTKQKLLVRMLDAFIADSTAE